MTNPIRVATACLSERIYAGRPTKDGKGFKEPRYDVTSDVLIAIRDKVGIGNQINVETGGAVEFRIAVLPPEASNPGDVEVAHADRVAYLSLNMLPEFDRVDVLAGRWDGTTGVQAFARHRIATRAPSPDMAEAVEILGYYADQFCELGKYHECCGKLGDDQCSGCKARAFLAHIGQSS